MRDMQCASARARCAAMTRHVARDARARHDGDASEMCVQDAMLISAMPMFFRRCCRFRRLMPPDATAPADIIF